MTSIPITDMDPGMMGRVYESGNTGKGGTSDFMGTLKNAMSTQANASGAGTSDSVNGITQTSNSSKVDDTKKAGNNEIRKTEDRISHKDEKVSAKSTKENAKVSEDTTEKIEQSAEEIVEEVSKQLGVDPQLVLDTINELGIELTDLFDLSTMTDMITQLTGVDQMSILMDEGLYQTLDTLKEFVGEITDSLMDELDLSQEALNEVLGQTEELLEQRGISINEFLDASKETEDIPLIGTKDYQTTTTVNGESVTMDVRVDDTTGAQTATFQTTGNKEDASSNEKNARDNDSNESTGRESLFNQNLQINNEVNVSDVNAASQDMLSYVTDAAEIADQIMENMKINLKPDVTELEMNLHPASLGNVRINLVAQDGQITAQFFAQNENVKNAIASQVVQLTQQLEEQGIKVEHVEVAVADHRFDHGAGEGGSQNQNSDSSKPRPGRIRRIDLSSLTDEGSIEELEEQDRIAAEMMAKDGNTVDYMA